MEKNKIELKVVSILILAFIVMSIAGNVINACVNGLPTVNEVPEGLTKEAVDIIAIVIFALTFVVCLPQIYIGIKGLRISNGASAGGKAHKVWAIILAIFAVIALISSISGVVKAFSVPKLVNLLDPIIDVALYAYYYVLCRRIEG